MKTPYPRINYEMTEADFEKLLDACKPTVCIKVGNYEGSSPQENANRAWKALGEKMGFEWDSCQPIEGKPARFFSAIPTEPENVRKEREKQEAEEAKQAKIKEIMAKVDDLQGQLRNLKATP
jgi:hypothetical protein